MPRTTTSFIIAEILVDYGFIVRYPEGKDSLTGYSYEPWHLRYLGKDLAKKVYNSNLTYDEKYAHYAQDDYKFYQLLQH